MTDTNNIPKPRISVHKFSSCDGCQLAFINAGETLLAAAEHVDVVHFAEAGMCDEFAPVDIAFVEGSISTSTDQARIEKIRANSGLLISIGACATSGGIQALRNMADTQSWVEGIYAQPEYIDSLENTTPISEAVKVDFQIWGCPVNGEQVWRAVHDLLAGAIPQVTGDKVCIECKRKQQICTLVTGGKPCLGPVTRGGCGAICPAFGRDCHGCFGPSSHINSAALGRRFEGLGLLPEEVAHRFLFINSQEPKMQEEGRKWQEKSYE